MTRVEALFSKEPALPAAAFYRKAMFTQSAREAWLRFLTGYKTVGSGTVLLPAYIGFTEREGSGVFDPVRQSGLPYRFYPVDSALETSVAALEREMAAGDVGVLLVVHWFGLPHVNLAAIRDLCARRRVLLVEDCAHVMGPPFQDKSGLGKRGQAALYSIHKMYGGDTGGALVLNEDLGFSVHIPDDVRCPGSILEAALATDCNAVAAHRRRLYQVYGDGLAGVDGLRAMYPDLGTHTPQSFAVIVEEGLREPLYFALMESGIPLTALYYRLIPEVEAERFPEAHSVAQNILNFPVHQSVSAEMAADVVAMTREALARLRS